jgi:hypothetical protein
VNSLPSRLITSIPNPRSIIKLRSLPSTLCRLILLRGERIPYPKEVIPVPPKELNGVPFGTDAVISLSLLPVPDDVLSRLVGRLGLAPYREMLRVPWTDSENEELKQLWGKGLSVDELTEHFPQRTKSAIRSQLNRLRHGNLRGDIDWKELIGLPSPSPLVVSTPALAPQYEYRPWTNTHDELLLKLEKNHTVAQLATIFHRSRGAIRSRLRHLDNSRLSPF